MVNFLKFEKSLGKNIRTKNAIVLNGAKLLLKQCEIFGIFPYEVAFQSKTTIKGNEIERDDCLYILFRVTDEYEYDTPVYIERTSYGHAIFTYESDAAECLIDNESIRKFLDWLDPLYFRNWVNA